MTRSIEWFPRAVDDLLAISEVSDAMRVDAAVQRFAASGIGFVRRIVRVDAPDEHRLYVNDAPYYAVIGFDGRVVYVWRVIHRS